MNTERKYWPTDDIRRYFDDPGFEVPGQPNYRNRPGRSGLDPIDFHYEFSHIKGRTIRMLLESHWHTRNPFYVIALIAFGLFFLLDLVAMIICPIIKIVLISPFCLLPLPFYFLIVPILLNRFDKFLNSLDEDIEAEEEETGIQVNR